jgi:hypothetical protein
MSCGPGSKGERLYDWALALAAGGRHLLIRRSLSSGELAYHLCWSPGPAALAGLVRVAGARRAVEQCFQAAKNEAALDHYQVRKHDAPGSGTSRWPCARMPGSPSRRQPAGNRSRRCPVTVTGPEKGSAAC